MYGSNNRGFAAAVITGGLIGVSGSSAVLGSRPPLPPAPPARPPVPEPHSLGSVGRSSMSEAAVDLIRVPADASVDQGRSVQVDYGQQAPPRHRSAEPRATGTGGHHAVAGSGGYRTVAEIVEASGGNRVVGGGGRRSRPEDTATSWSPSGDTVTSWSPSGDTGASRSPSGVHVAANGPEPGQPGQPARSRLFRDRAVESSLPNAAVVSQRFTVEATGPRNQPAPTNRHGSPTEYRGEYHRGRADPAYRVDHGADHGVHHGVDHRGRGGQYLAEPRQPRHDTRMLNSETAALSSLDTSGLFGTLHSPR